MKFLQSILVALVIVAVATPAQALRPAEIKRYSTAAALLARSPRDGTLAHAMDTDAMYLMAAGVWLKISPNVPAVSITTTATLDATHCGKTIFVTAGIDTKSITLPATISGCTYKLVYNGADDGALVDISPNANDGIHGTCTLAASALEFSGTDDADIGLTKNTVNTGDTITLEGDGSVGWFVSACAGIWANN